MWLLASPALHTLEERWMSNGKRLSFHTLTRRIDPPVQKEHVTERVRKRKGNGCNCQYCKSSNQEHFRKAAPMPNIHEHLFESQGKSQASERDSCTQKETSVREENQQILVSEFGKQLSEINAYLNVIQTSTRNARHFKAPPCDQRPAEWNEEQEEFAIHKAYKLHNELFKIKGHNKYFHKTNFFRSYVPTKAKNTATGLAIHSTERLYMKRRRLFDSRAKFWIFRSPMEIAWSQTRKRTLRGWP